MYFIPQYILLSHIPCALQICYPAKRRGVSADRGNLSDLGKFEKFGEIWKFWGKNHDNIFENLYQNL